MFDLHDDALRAGTLAGLLPVIGQPDVNRANVRELAGIRTPSVVGRGQAPVRPTMERTSFWVGGEAASTSAGTVLVGQMFVERLRPSAGATGRRMVLVHGGGGQGTDYLTTPDGRPGWAPLLAEAGHDVYVVDRPGHGRSPYHPDALGPMAPIMGAETMQALFRNPPEGPFAHPMARVHSQWPGGDQPDDAVWRQFIASAGPLMADESRGEELALDGLVALLEEIGPSVVVVHSLGGPSGYLVADARPDLVEALVAVEPIGPQFARNPDLGLNLAWGVTSVPVTYDPPVAEASELALVEVPTPAPFPVVVQADPPRRLANLSRVPIALVSAEGSAFRWFGEPVAGFLRQAGCRVDLVRLWERGVRGNGHGVMVELNNADALRVVTDWIQQALGAEQDAEIEQVAR